MKTVRRMAILASTTFALCAVIWLTVDTFATDPIQGRRRDSWAKPQWSGAPQRVAVDLLLIAAVAFAGRKVLRLKL